MRHYENRLMLMLFFTNGLLFFDRLAINFLTPFLNAEFKLSGTQIGALTASLAITWALSGIVVSRLVDRYERKKTVLVIAVIAFSACSMGSGLAAGFAGLLAMRCLMGIAEGPVLPIAQTLMIVEASPHRRGFSMGVIQAVAAGVFGSVLGPAIIIPLAEAHGWRTAFFLAGAPGLLMALILMRYVREPSLERIARRLHPATGDADAAGSSAQRNIALCAVVACLFITTFYSVIVFAPAYLVEQRGFTPGEMGAFMVALGIAAVIGGALVPALSDRVGRKPALVASFLVSACAPLVVAWLDVGLPLSCVAIFLAWLGMGAMPVMLATVPAESVHGSVSNRAIGLVIGVSEVIGGCLSPVLSGLASDLLGRTAPFAIGATAAAAAALVGCFLVETAPGRRLREAPGAASKAMAPTIRQAR